MPKAIHLQICPVCSLRSMLFTFYVSITSLLLCTNILIGKDNGRKYQRRIFIYIITTFMYFLGKNSISLEKEPLLNNNHLQESQKLTKCRSWDLIEKGWQEFPTCWYRHSKKSRTSRKSQEVLSKCLTATYWCLRFLWTVNLYFIRWVMLIVLFWQTHWATPTLKGCKHILYEEYKTNR